jgi:outer membrane protein assembly factor BamB
VTFTAAEYLFDVDRESGTRSWHRQLDAKTTTRPVRTATGVVVGVDDGTVRRFDRDGTPTGRFDVGTGAVNGILAIDDLLVATTSQNLVMHDPEGGERVRTLEDVGQLVSLTAGSERVYAVDRAEPAIVAVDRDDHDVVWRKSLSTDVLGGPAVLEGTVLVRLGPVGGADQEQDPALVALT